MAEQSIEAKSRAIAAKRNEPGEEFKDYQSAANQLLEIQAAQKENLNMARLEGAADASQNELLAQSAALMAANNTSQAGGNAQLNPATQTILNKYGLGAPKVIKQTERVVTPQKINITNNNITNNNVSVPANIGGPLQGRPLQFSQPQDNTGNFKNWISNVFARQEANAVKRQAEYDKKDRSLTRSANRVMRKLEDMTKTLGSNLDPRRIGSTWQSQLKTLGFLFGLHLLTKNWEKILDGVKKIGDWFQDTLDYFGIVRKNKDDGGQCRFVKDVVKFLGGQEGETIGQALIKLFGKDGIAGLIMAKMTQLFGDFSDRVKLFFEERGAAVKQIKFPDVEPGSGVIGVIKSLGVYLADILACLTGGTAAAKQSVVNNIYNTGALDSEKGDGWKTNYNKFSGNTHGWVKDKDGNTIRNTSWGDASVAGTRTQRGQNTLDSFDVVDNGRGLLNNTNSAIKQSRAITSMAGDLESGKVHTGAIMTGMERLKSSVNQDGYALVDPDFVKKLGENLGIEELKNLNLDKQAKNYKFIRVEKTDEDYAREGANIGKAALEGGLEGAALEKLKEFSGANWFETFLATGNIIQDPGKKALWDGLVAAGKKAFAEKNRLILVPSNDPRPAVRIDNQETFRYLELDAKSIKAIEEAIGKALKVTDTNGNSTFTFDVTDKASREAFNTSLTNTIKAGMRDKESKMVAAQQGVYDPDAWRTIADYRSRMANVREDNTDLSENTEALQQLSSIEQSQAAVRARYENRKEERRQEYESSIEGNRAIQVGENISEAATNAYNSIKARVDSVVNFSGQKDYVAKMVPFFENKVKEKNLAKEKDAKEYAYWLTAQSGVESAWGKSGLSKKYNNYSGIKAVKDDPAVYLNTTEYINGQKKQVKQPFRVYKTIDEWADKYLNLLSGKRYKAFEGDPDKYINRVKAGGYATDPNYISKITSAKRDTVNIFSKVKPEELEYAEIREPIIPEPAQNPEVRKEEVVQTPPPPLIKENSQVKLSYNNSSEGLAQLTIKKSDNIETETLSPTTTLGKDITLEDLNTLVDQKEAELREWDYSNKPVDRTYYQNQNILAMLKEARKQKGYVEPEEEEEEETEDEYSFNNLKKSLLASSQTGTFYIGDDINGYFKFNKDSGGITTTKVSKEEYNEHPMNWYLPTLKGITLPEVAITAERPKTIKPLDISIASTGKDTAVPSVNTENITSGEINPLSPLNKENVTSVSDLLASIKNGIDYGNKINELGVSATGQVVDSNAQIVQAIVATGGKQGGKQVYASREYSSSPNTDNIG